MPEQDHKTKDFLRKIDLLIERGVVKNHAEVVVTLNWNKSVMSSVKTGQLLVPQHIYNKFKEVYAEQLNSIAPKPVLNNNADEDFQTKYIALLEKRNHELEEARKTLLEKVSSIEQTLIQMRTDMGVMAALQKGYQEYWAEYYPPKNSKPDEALKRIHSKALLSLKKIQQEGIRL